MSIDQSHLQISVQEQERWRRRMSVTVPAALVADEERKAAAKLASRMKLKGFRKGRVPKSVVQSRFSGALRRETLDRIVGEAFRKALASENLQPISEGELEDLSYEPQQDLTFAIAFDVQPEIEVGRLGGFAVERPRVEVGDEHVDKVLQSIQRQNGVWSPAGEGKPKNGDLVSVRIHKLDNEDAGVEGAEDTGTEDAEGKDYEFVLGEGQALPEIEEAITTLASGESGTFTVTFPDDFPDEARRGDRETVEITLSGWKVLELPDLDDALASQVGDFETLEQLKDQVREDLVKDATQQAENVVRGRLLELLMDANPFEVPRSMVERYTDTVLGDQQGLPSDRLEEVRSSIRPEAERAVKRFLLMERIAETQQLAATEVELDERVQNIAERNNAAPEKVYASLQKSGQLEALEREITEAKVFDFLTEQSEITDAPGT
ncbi:MAG: trigger factor [Gemmatimonadota bacterium]